MPEPHPQETAEEAADEQAIEEAAESAAGTASTWFRWRWLSTLSALILHVTFAVAALTGSMPGGTAGDVFNVAFGMAVIYALGPGTLREWRQAKATKTEGA